MGRVPEIFRFCPFCGEEVLKTAHREHVCDFVQDHCDYKLLVYDLEDSCEDD